MGSGSVSESLLGGRSWSFSPCTQRSHQFLPRCPSQGGLAWLLFAALGAVTVSPGIARSQPARRLNGLKYTHVLLGIIGKLTKRSDSFWPPMLGVKEVLFILGRGCTVCSFLPWECESSHISHPGCDDSGGCGLHNELGGISSNFRAGVTPT